MARAGAPCGCRRSTKPPYIPDSGGGGTEHDQRLISYDDLFSAWELHLRFVIAGRTDDARISGPLA